MTNFFDNFVDPVLLSSQLVVLNAVSRS